MTTDAMEDLRKRVAALEMTLKRVIAAFGGAPQGGAAVADDADLDSKYGDPPVKRDPSAKYWTGASMVGRTLSECPPDYLDAFARYKDACAYANEKEGDPDKAKYVGYDRKDAARARGWAARMRSGRIATPQMSAQTGGASHVVPEDDARELSLDEIF